MMLELLVGRKKRKRMLSTRKGQNRDNNSIGGRKDTIEGETYSRIPFYLQENSLTQSNSPITTINPIRSSIETSDSISINNHCYQSDLYLNRQTKNSIQFSNIYLKQQKRNRFRLFKFRRKKFSNHFNKNNNNSQIIHQQSSVITIEQILHRQWIQTFKQKLTKVNTKEASLNISECRTIESFSTQSKLYSSSINCELNGLLRHTHANNHVSFRNKNMQIQNQFSNYKLEEKSCFCIFLFLYET
ncbi:unnamed protein product [Adineta steineri]|uniref:Uncharacterized protein n=1 Tax=Adineta steineri TaxID=433720 RepID=A0A813P8I5_9BILA|nr:unnamed protein product [Adineta steineri]